MKKEINQLVRILEGALFASEHPLSIDRMQSLFDEVETPDKKTIHEALEQLVGEYSDRGVELKELASGFQFQVKADLAKWVQRLQEDKTPRYSRALLETLVLIAYRQPITRGEIEEIRGVTVNSNIIKTLMEREWVKEVGYRDLPGKPALLATTKAFLDYFGLKRLDELPPLSEIQDLDKAGEALAMQLKLEDQITSETDSIEDFQAKEKSSDDSLDQADTNQEDSKAQLSDEIDTEEINIEQGDFEEQENELIETLDESQTDRIHENRKITESAG